MTGLVWAVPLVVLVGLGILGYALTKDLDRVDRDLLGAGEGSSWEEVLSRLVRG